MSTYTHYDQKRDELKEELQKCLQLSKALVVGEDIWGYDSMSDEYAIDIYLAIKNAIEKV